MEKLNNLWEALLIWDQVEALESLGIKIDLTDEEIVAIAAAKARAEKEEELRSEKETKARAKEFMDNMVKGMDFKESRYEDTDIVSRKQIQRLQSQLVEMSMNLMHKYKAEASDYESLMSIANQEHFLYDTVFKELIGQVKVNMRERGEILEVNFK